MIRYANDDGELDTIDVNSPLLYMSSGREVVVQLSSCYRPAVITDQYLGFQMYISFQGQYSWLISVLLHFSEPLTSGRFGPLAKGSEKCHGHGQH